MPAPVVSAMLAPDSVLVEVRVMFPVESLVALFVLTESAPPPALTVLSVAPPPSPVTVPEVLTVMVTSAPLMVVESC